jgi:hypothetical protein
MRRNYELELQYMFMVRLYRLKVGRCRIYLSDSQQWPQIKIVKLSGSRAKFLNLMVTTPPFAMLKGLSGSYDSEI